MPLNVSNINMGKAFAGSIQIGKAYVSDSLIYTSAPDFLYQNGAVDGEYLKTMTGSNNWNEDGYGFSSGDFSINKDKNIYLASGASSGYGNTYSCENKAVSNAMDLSGATHLQFIGNAHAEASYHHWQWFYIELIDKNNKTVTLHSGEASVTGSNYVPSDIAINKTARIDNLSLDLTQVKLQLRYGYKHNAPWENWSAGGGNLTINEINVTS